MDNKKQMEDLISGSIHSAFKKNLSYISYCVFVGALSWVAASYFTGSYDKDSTDSSSKRSGMKLHVDNLTGCHYLSAAAGGITPRISKNGSHFGCYTLPSSNTDS